MADSTGQRLYSCFKCGNLVCCHDDIISKNFQASHGRAFLFSHAMNIVEGPKENRNLMTGLHVVSDIYCVDCQENLGWKYDRAYEESEKYKEGKVVLEKFKIVKHNWFRKEPSLTATLKAVAELLKSGHETMKPPRSLIREVVT